MTANLVNGLGSQMNLIPGAAASSNHSSGTDFSEVLNSSRSKEAGKSLNGNENQNDKLNQSTKTEKVDKSEKKQEVSENRSDKTKETKETSKDTETKTNSLDESGKPDEEVMEQVAEAVATMIQTVAEVLEVPVEEVTEAIDALELTEMDILDTANIPNLVVEVTGAEDAAAIMTDENLFADVKELMETSENLIAELAEGVDVPIEELKGQIADKAKEIKAENVENDNKSQLVNVMGNETDAAALTQIKNENTSENAKQGNDRNSSSRDEHSNQAVSFSQSVTDTLKMTVDDVVTEMPLSYSNTSMEDILEQVTDSLKTTMKDDITEMEMQLHPASLGNVKIQVAARDGIITANFTTQNEEVKQALETQIIQLKEQMNEQGIKVEAVEVAVDAHAFERNFNNEHDQSNGQNEAEAKKKRVRGINLSGMDLNNLDEIDEEDRVTADMMAKQGNTVDYLA